MDSPWRTVIVEESLEASLQDEQMVLQSKENRIQIPIYQIREIVFSACCGSITIPLLEKLAENHVVVLLCSQKRYPVGKLCEISSNFESSGRIMDQAAWTVRRKSAIWKQIVKMKISMQMELLQRIDHTVPDKMHACKKEVMSNDSTNREAVAAKLYFSQLFGDSFTRFESDDVNAALNYGYSILCSAFCRAITMHGYCTELGIHHCSRQNSYNLACDLMEPFRPFIDEIVYRNIDREFDITYRRELVSILHGQCLYHEKKMIIADAIEAFALDTLSAMNEPRQVLEEVGFCDV